MWGENIVRYGAEAPLINMSGIYSEARIREKVYAVKKINNHIERLDRYLA